ncbi:MAG: cupin domain-containing protein [Sphaerochaetaceae bacterium]
MAILKAQDIIEKLGLLPLEGEGGYFRKIYTHRSGAEILGGTIYYLITPASFSSLHWLPTDEVWYFLEGSPLNQLVLFPDGRNSMTILGFAKEGHTPVTIVPGGCWQGTKMGCKEGYALCATTMVPPYVAERYKKGNRELIKQWPDCPYVEEYLV